MTAKELFSKLLDGAIEIMNPTCDGLIVGDENKIVCKAATCFKLTAEVIKKAIDLNVDMIITHEPPFTRGDGIEKANPTDIKKFDMLKESDIVLYRLHDHAHNREIDYIHAGFIRDLDLKIKHKYERSCLGVCRYELCEETTTNALARRIEEKLGIRFVRIVGKDDYPVKTICLGLGSVGTEQIEILHNPGCDVFITGEVGEVCPCEYIKDACFFGDNKSVILLGHYGAEFSGMRLLAEEMNDKIVSTQYIDSGEVYHGI